MQVFEGSELTFLIPKIFRTLQYDIVMRHEHDPDGNFPDQWEKVSYEVISLDGPPSGECSETGGEANPEYDASEEYENVVAESADGSGASPDTVDAEGSTGGTVEDSVADILALGGGGQNEVSSGNATHVIAKGEFSMSPDQKETTIKPTICLEESKRYNITFTFTQYSSTPDPSAIINIDSVSTSDQC